MADSILTGPTVRTQATNFRTTYNLCNDRKTTTFNSDVIVSEKFKQNAVFNSRIPFFEATPSAVLFASRGKMYFFAF